VEERSPCTCLLDSRQPASTSTSVQAVRRERIELPCLALLGAALWVLLGPAIFAAGPVSIDGLYSYSRQQNSRDSAPTDQILEGLYSIPAPPETIGDDDIIREAIIVATAVHEDILRERAQLPVTADAKWAPLKQAKGLDLPQLTALISTVLSEVDGWGQPELAFAIALQAISSKMRPDQIADTLIVETSSVNAATAKNNYLATTEMHARTAHLSILPHVRGMIDKSRDTCPRRD
jgi:hypothetical protein